ncbi:MAG: histidine--tRNA ligase [Nanoarchaeota archaeon]|nr:histidine--tRNA ligase [Nanoarchaeota archaeon]|tara:strand:+ start:2183 stop:3436 length:1254 start_codon:yes stop_codon:yes gene_type:complete
MQLAKGVCDIEPSEKILKNKVVDRLRKTFELYGFSPLETPLIERYETLASKFAAGEDSDALRETFTLQDQGKRRLGLRFDLTVPLARFMAMNPTIKMPFKRFEMGPVFRDGPIRAGRVRQFWQCDADIIGNSSMLADAECLAVVAEGFIKLDIPVTIKVNNRKLLSGILTQCNVNKKQDAIIAIDKLDKIGKTGVQKELRERKFTKKQIDAIFTFVSSRATISSLKKKLTDEEALEGIKELEEVFSYLKQMNVKVDFDVALARGLAYYTGTVFEAFANKSKVTSSLSAGGRWDDMIGKFIGDKIVPAVGLSFGIVPIMEVLKEKTKLLEKTKTQVYVLPIKTENECLGIVQQLRKAGINSDISDKSISKGLDYADALGIPYVLIVGKRELAKKKVTLKNMKTGKEELLTVNQVIKKL